MKKKYGYARVSSKEQNLDRQIKALLEAGVDERDIVTDKASGKSLEREGYQMLKTRMLRDGDTLLIKSLDRLSRNKLHIKSELEYFQTHKIRVMILDIPTTMAELPEEQVWVFEMINTILIEVLASIAEQERLTTRQRQAEGIAIAKAKGTKFGRKAIAIPTDFEQQYQLWRRGKQTAKTTMANLNLKKSKFYSFVREYEARNEELKKVS